MSSSILEFRQNNATNVIQNGDWINTLKKNVVIEDGDVVRLNSAFIDTRKSSTQQIIIPNDLVIYLTLTHYLTDWVSTGDKINYIASNGNTGLITHLCDKFIPNKIIPADKLLDCKIMKSVEFIASENSKPLNIVYSYFNTTDLGVFSNSQITPPTNAGGIYEDTLNLIFDTSHSFVVLNSQAELQEYGWSIKQYNSIDIPPNTNVHEPWQFSASTIIKAGVYNPDELAIIFSKQLSKNPADDLSDIINNTIPQNPSFFIPQVANPLISMSGDYQPFFLPGSGGSINPDGTSTPRVVDTYLYQNNVITDNAFRDTRFRFKEGASNIEQTSYWLGTNQFALQYNADIQKFQFSFMHFPMYDAETGSNIVVRYNADPLEDLWYIAKQNSGVVINGLYCEELTSNKKINFFDEILGFDLSSLICKPFIGKLGKFYNDTVDTLYYSISIIEGKHTTGAYVGIDSAIIKGKNLWYQAQILQDDGETVSFEATSSDTITIDAVQSLPLLLAEQYSHFIIDMNLKFSNSMIGSQDIYNNVQAIVNKYEAYGGYVSGDSSSAIEYQHKGAPIILQGAKVRILNSDHELDDELGSDNTVFIQIIKNVNPKTGTDIFNQ